MPEIAETAKPPYYAVIFTSRRATGDDDGYAEMAQKMDELARRQPGFLGVESAREDLGITISYWTDLDSIKAWRLNAEHRLAQMKGYETFYRSFTVRVCRVEREYGFERRTK